MRPTLEQLKAYKGRFPVPKFELPENIYSDDFDVTEAERATKHEYDPKTKQWRRTMINIIMDKKPFAEGAMRAAFHMRDLSTCGQQSMYVAKLAKVAGTPVAQYFEDVKMQAEVTCSVHLRIWRRSLPHARFAGGHVCRGVQQEGGPEEDRVHRRLRARAHRPAQPAHLRGREICPGPVCPPPPLNAPASSPSTASCAFPPCLCIRRAALPAMPAAPAVRALAGLCATGGPRGARVCGGQVRQVQQQLGLERRHTQHPPGPPPPPPPAPPRRRLSVAVSRG